MSSTFPPVKGAAFTLDCTLYNISGSVVNPSTVTKLVSKDGGAFAAITADAVEVNGTYGLFSVTLNGTEMNADRVSWYITATVADTIPYTGTLYTSAQNLDDIEGKVDGVEGALTNVAASLSTAILDLGNPTYGLSALETLVDGIESGMATAASLAEVQTYLAASIVDAQTYIVASLPVAPTTVEINAYLAASHGSGAWGSTVSGWTLVNQATLDTSSVALGPITVGGDATAGVIVTAYASSDTDFSDPVNQTTTDGSGNFSFYLDSGTYVVIATYSGANFASRSLTVA